MVKLNCLTLGELENEHIFKKKWSVPLIVQQSGTGSKNTFNFLHRRIDFIDNLYNFKCRPTVSYRLLVDGMLLLKSSDRIFNLVFEFCFIANFPLRNYITHDSAK